MVRAGEGGRLIEAFEKGNYVAIGWGDWIDLATVSSRHAVRDMLEEKHADMARGTLGVVAGMLHKFSEVMQEQDRVLSYDTQAREYLVGTIVGPYIFKSGGTDDYAHSRSVRWDGRVARDSLRPTSKNTLGSTLSLFLPGAEVLQDIEQALEGSSDADTDIVVEEDEEHDTVRRDTLSRSHEFIRDRILALSPDDMEQLVAALLRAMGYKARVTPAGPDRGRDVIASPDGLGLQQPRIVVEVKHRQDRMGADAIRSFVGGLREADRGLYVSTGGFTREARYEADRATMPTTLVDSDELTTLVVDNYETFNAEGRVLLPLTRVYWPA